ncbi:ATP-binding protein [Niabella ginsenosidivorans]|uniref:ATP-binding protein n=1 Tax=Niabella ginsenosidivorans TaxID=1176587 RepID=UPI001C54F342|nr:ATP-binding protein [Niabella ginsenosidivorans]
MNTNTQATLQQLQALKLYGMAKRYEAVMQLHSHQQPDAHTIIASLGEAELSYRTHRRTELYLRLSKLRYNATP